MTHPIPYCSRFAATVLLALAAINAWGAESAAETAGNPEAGREKARICVGCHGPRGMGTMPRYPHLAGQQAVYLVSSIVAYRDGRRSDPEMAPMVANLSDEDIRDIAAFYAGRSACDE